MKVSTMAHYMAVALCGWVLIACTGNNEFVGAATVCNGQAVETERLFLQQLSSNSVIIKWRGPGEQLCFGQDADQLTSLVDSVSKTEGNHKEVKISGLQPDTRYYYSLGGAGRARPGDHFTTAPKANALPASGKLRLWILGDSGTGGEGQKAVRDGFMAFNNNERVDGILMLGDNAYPEGSDQQFQAKLFDIYPDHLRSIPIWPAIGNHEMGVGTFTYHGKVIEGGGGSISADPNSWIGKAGDQPRRAPFLDIFSFPTQGENGGVPSGTELYYSFNYGNLHIVSFDSQVSIRDTAKMEKMKAWLIDDLTQNSADWTIVILHHPPYSKGHHDTDIDEMNIDQPVFTVREIFTPIFEQYGVDLVYSGHSHAYERSYYIKDHTGFSTSFDPRVHAELNAQGVPLHGGEGQGFSQITASGRDDKVVYTVLGSSGGAKSPVNRHPAHVKAIPNEPGSVVLDATRTRLTSRFIDAEGVVKDQFSITR